LWTIKVIDNFGFPVFKIVAKTGEATISMVRDEYACLKIPDEIRTGILIQSLEMIQSSRRAPRANNRKELASRRFSVKELLGGATTADELFQRFREEAAI
jgi:hypothetical protein